MVSSLEIASPIPPALILDFHDSYTRNLLTLFSRLPELEIDRVPGQHSATWTREGWQERVVVVDVDSLTWDEFVADILPCISCVVIGPGPGSPHKTSDFSWPKRLIQEFGNILPIFGVCLGHQGLATAFGGEVIKSAAPRHGQVSKIRHSSNELFAGIPQDFEVIQYNSLVVVEDSLPVELEAIGWTSNQGRPEIMALRHRAQPLWGVQFHPESISSTYGPNLLSNFLVLAAAHRQRLTPSFDLSLPLPLHLQSLTTSYKRGLPSLIPDLPRIDPLSNLQSWAWEQRTVSLGTSDRTPREVFEGLIKSKSLLGEVWLDSARPTVSPQFSHLFNPSATWAYSHPSKVVNVRQSPQPSSAATLSLAPPQTFFSLLGTAQGILKRQTQIADPSLPTFPLGFVGYFGYEMKEVPLPSCASSPTSGEPDRTDAEFAVADTLLSYEHATRMWSASGLVRVGGGTTESRQLEQETGTKFGLDEADWKTFLTRTQLYFSNPTTTIPHSDDIPPYPTHKFTLGSITPDMPKSPYQHAIESARQSIIAGDAYELCLTTQFRTLLPPAVAKDPYGLYLALRTANPAPYSAYFHLPLSSISVLSSSPERFLKIDKNGEAEMKPIKGTVRRSGDPLEDLRRKKELESDVKERAENLMIVDLCRHDLAGFCKIESIKVPKLMVVESYETVHQLVTSIVGTLTPAVNPFEAVARAFPPGSMTGAPKLRSVKILEDLEGHRPRGVYSGTFGYVAVDGSTDFAVVIRTLVIRGTELAIGAGGAITHLSEVEKEWEEVLVKTEAVLGIKD